MWSLVQESQQPDVRYSGELVAKNPPAHAGGTGDMGSILGSGKSLGVGNSNPLQYSCLENFMDRGA